MMKNKFKKALQAAVILSSATLFPWQAMAAGVEEVEYEVYENEFFYNNNNTKPYFTADIVVAGENTQYGIAREMEDDEFTAFEEQAIVYLGDITGLPKDKSPLISLTPLDIKDANASAISKAYKETGLTKYASYFIGDGIEKNNGEAAADVTVNLAPEGSSWYIEKYPILPVNGIDADYAGTIVHEMVHAMGVLWGNKAQYVEDEEYCFNLNVPSKYADGLYDVFGRNVKNDLEADEEGGDLPVKAITIEKYNELKNSVISDEYFYIIKEPEKLGFYGGVYFSGENVSEVLNGAKIAWANGAALDAVPGIPIECYERENPELSHLELQNGLMSHQNYRNWCTLMEAELAVLQDIGFTDIKRDKFFGHSIYASNLNEAAGKIVVLANKNKSDGKSWESATDRAIGLHIYGSNNIVSLGSADGDAKFNYGDVTITANGSYSMGVRIDGARNTLTINDGVKISVGDNKEKDIDNYGLSVNYGRNHNVIIGSNASVIAMGKGSIGAVFDFGSNELGDRIEYRGSYIRGKYDSDKDKFTNLAFAETSALAGALVDTFIVNGTLSGEKAIYISPNALVKTINIAGNDDNNSVAVNGDIISEWNPEGVEYFYTRNYDGENPYKGLKPNIKLATGETLDNYRTNLNFKGDRTFTDNIIGPYGLIMNVKSNAFLTTDNPASDKFSYVNVYCLNIESNATLNVNNIVMAKDGYGSINVANGASFKLGEATIGKMGAVLIAFNDEDTNGDGIVTSGIINNEGAVDFRNGELALKPDAGFYADSTEIKVMLKADDNDGDPDTSHEQFGDIWFVNMNGEKVEDDANTRSSSVGDFVEVTNTLSMKAEQGNDTNGKESNIIILTIERSFDNVELDEDEEVLGDIIEEVDGSIDTLTSTGRDKEWKDMIGAIDFLKTDKEINNALGQLLPSSYGYGAMATMDLHRMLSDFAVGGSIAPAHNVKEKGKWHNIVIPYASETDHIKNGTGYKNNHSGMIGAMERTLDDVTVGWHAALNHQSTTGAEIGRLKGDGLYLGAQVKYAPKAWNGWSTFGIARLGVEDFEMQRNFNFNGYNGKVDSDFTAISGNLRVGGAYEKEAKEMTFGPFAALDYAFAHHPSIEEDGVGAGRLSVESGTYDSLRTQLGYRVQTAPKHLEDRTYWQANAAIAWNHELFGDAGNVSASFRDFGGTTFGCDVDNYGRDSLSLMAGMTFKNPSKLDVTFNLGTDIYRHGGDTLYAKCALEWKF